MHRTVLRAVLGASIAGVLVLSTATGAMAADSTTRVSQTIVGVGSDTTYEVMMDLDKLYDGSAGCPVIPANGTAFSTFKETCVAGGQTAYGGTEIETENVYHDRAVEAFPVGSGNGKSILTQYVTTPGSALDAAYSRASSDQTFAAPAGTTAYQVAYARDGLGYWLGLGNLKVAHTGTGAKAIPTANMTLGDLTNIFIGNSGGQCLNTFSTSKTDSANQTSFGAPGSGNIKPFATQVGSGTGKDFANKITGGVHAYADASALQDCIPATAKDGNPANGEHVIFENNAHPICDQQGGTKSFQTSAIYPYSFGRFVQNKAGSGTCAGRLGKVNGIALNLTTVAENASPVYPLARYVMNYMLLPNSITVTNTSMWGNGSDENLATLDYLDPINGWLCKTSAHAKDPQTGVSYRTEIVNTLNADGFAALPSAPVGGSTWSGNSFCRNGV